MIGDILFKMVGIILHLMIFLILHFLGTITPMEAMVLEMNQIIEKDTGIMVP